MADDKFDAAERKRREAAVQFARANVELEGFRVTPEEEVHCQRFINGEIDLAEFVGGQGAGGATRGNESLVDFMRASPLAGHDEIEFERSPSLPRDLR